MLAFAYRSKSVRPSLIFLFSALVSSAHAQLPPIGGQASDNVTVGQIALGSLLPATLPYTLNQGMIQIKISVSDGIPQDAVIATALPLTMVSPALASRQSLKPGAVLDVSTLLGPVKATSVPAQSMHLGRLLLSAVPMCIFDMAGHLSSKGLKEPPSVWLGTSSIGGIVTTIDPERQNITLSPPTAAIPASAIKVPFQLRNGRIYLQVKVNDQKNMECMLDTTAAGSLLPADVCKSLKLPALATFPTVNTDGKPIKLSVIEVPIISIGTLAVKGVQAVYVSEGVDTRSDAEVGVLGNDILLQYRVTIHYPQRILAFETIKAPGTTPTVLQSPSAQLPAPPSGKSAPKKKP